jgi:tetratricopeptide (TPR) repeat protein
VYLLYFQNLLKSRRLLVIFFVLTAVFLIYLNSRVAIFSFVLCNGLLFFASIKYSLLEKGGKALYFLISILLVTGIFLLTQKSGSTTGRLFIYKVVFLNFKSYFLGGGVNSFTEIYPGYLKGYFEITGVTNLDDLANVTVPEYAYNEFLQIFIELGLVELLLFSVSFFPVLNRKRLLHDTKYLCVLVLLLNSFVSYTFHNAILYTLLIILLAVIHKEHLLSQSVILPNRLVTNVVSILLITTGSLLGIVYYHFHNLKMKTTHNSNASCTELKNDYFCLDKVYKRDSKFINNYSKAMLYNCNDTILATNILKKAKKEIPEYENLLLLGEIYFSRNLIDSAELNFKEAVKYLPNRFIPLYYLQNISLLKGDTIKAKLYAERILYLPVKIPSIDITIAKLNAENFMKILK